MAKINVIESGLAGFHLLSRRPGLVIGWGFVFTLFAIAPLFVLALMLLPSVLPLLNDPTEAQQGQAGLGIVFTILPWLVLAFFWWLALELMAVTCVFRAVLEPQERGFLHLKLGGDEGRLLLLLIVHALLFAVGYVATLAVGGIAIGAATMLPDPVNGLLIAVVALALFAGWIVVLVRLSMAAPQTFAEKKLRIFDSWSLTRGSFWRLVLLFLFNSLIVWGLAVLVVLAVFMLLAFTGVMGQFAGMSTAGDPDIDVPWAALAPGLILTLLFMVGVQGLLQAVQFAPYARAYRDLVGGSEETA